MSRKQKEENKRTLALVKIALNRLSGQSQEDYIIDLIKYEKKPILRDVEKLREENALLKEAHKYDMPNAIKFIENYSKMKRELERTREKAEGLIRDMDKNTAYNDIFKCGYKMGCQDVVGIKRPKATPSEGLRGK